MYYLKINISLMNTTQLADLNKVCLFIMLLKFANLKRFVSSIILIQVLGIFLNFSFWLLFGIVNISEELQSKKQKNEISQDSCFTTSSITFYC
jgi:hypothetical protein